MQNEIEALLKALLAEQQRERDLYHSLLAAMAVAASSRRRMVEDIVTASKNAIPRDEGTFSTRSPSIVAQDLLTEAIKKMSEARRGMFNGLMN